MFYILDRFYLSWLLFQGNWVDVMMIILYMGDYYDDSNYGAAADYNNIIIIFYNNFL